MSRRAGHAVIPALSRRPPAPAPDGALLDAACTDVGLVRRSNEDAFLARPDAGLWAVADGMGGHEDGEWAAEAIVHCLDELPLGGDFDADAAALAEAVRTANAVIHDRAQARRLRMGSTVVTLLIGDGRFAVVWVGDSRAYRLRDGRLAQLTTDHTQVQAKVARGLMTAAEARAHPMAHVLSRAVGAEAEVEVSSLAGEVRGGDVFLLCSDGVHGTMPDAEVAAILDGAGPARACEKLIARCHAGGAPDNATAVVVAVAAA